MAERLKELGEMNCSKEVLDKLRKISAKTIDRKLKHQKEIERIRKKYQKKVHPLLYQKIPVKLSDEWDRSQLGNIQTDLIEHCGQSARGEYIKYHLKYRYCYWLVGRRSYYGQSSNSYPRRFR
jgi:hypothetical protein